VPIFDLAAFRAAVHPGKYSVTGQIAGAVGLGGVAEAWFEGRSLWDAFQNPKPLVSGLKPGDHVVAKQSNYQWSNASVLEKCPDDLIVQIESAESCKDNICQIFSTKL